MTREKSNKMTMIGIEIEEEKDGEKTIAEMLKDWDAICKPFRDLAAKKEANPTAYEHNDSGTKVFTSNKTQQNYIKPSSSSLMYIK